jgi:hypothetical protein
MVNEIGDFLATLEGTGFFDLLLPLLLIFAVVYGILSYMKVFGGNRAIHTIVALVISFLTVRTPFFRDFLSFVSPRLGVGLIIILVVLILTGMFVPEKGQGVVGIIFLAIGGIISAFIFLQANEYFGFSFGFLENDIMATLVVILIIGAAIGVIVGLTPTKKKMSVPEKLGALFDG